MKLRNVPSASAHDLVSAGGNYQSYVWNMISRLTYPCAVTLLCLACGTGQAESCRNKSFQGAAYITCSFDPAKQDLRLFWRGADHRQALSDICGTSPVTLRARASRCNLP